MNKRLNPHNHYEIIEFEGHQIQSMNRSSIVSNKLLALSNRRYNRDLYDVHFLLSRDFPEDFRSYTRQETENSVSLRAAPVTYRVFTSLYMAT
ncbi:MAG: nucleotidyl transferase AbiEii/AbiGii toxin family protein [Candidatus Peribacteria bacterium]|nr:nucleotidyl transferase AbiEii/AbiGii toxin family protein [Candidatus Peribacteria bacterium]